MSQRETIPGQSPEFAPVAKSGAMVAITAALCRIASVGKELFVAFVLGAGLATDAYALVMLIPSFSMALLVQAVRGAFLTLYPQQALESEHQGQSLANRFLYELLVVAGAVALVAWIGLWWLWPRLLFYSDQALVETSRPLLALACGLVIATTAVAALSAVLNAYGRFTIPQATAVLPTLVVVVAVAYWRQDGGAWVLVGGLLAGTIVQAAALLLMLVRAGHRFRRIEPKPDVARQTIWRLALPVIAVSMLSQVNVYVDRTMASGLQSGAVAVLAWSGMLRDLVAGTLIGGFISVLLPHFSTLIARGNPESLGSSCSILMRGASLVLFPLSALAIVCLPLIGPYMAFGRLDAHDASLLAGCVAAYSVGFFADMTSNILFQGLLALRQVRLLMWLSLFASFLPNLILNLALIRPFGAVGLALSTSVVGYVTLAANYLVLRKWVKFENERRTWTLIAMALAMTLMAEFAAFLAGQIVLRALSDWRYGGLFAALVAAGVFSGCYLFLVFVFPGIGASRNRERGSAGARPDQGQQGHQGH